MPKTIMIVGFGPGTAMAVRRGPGVHSSRGSARAFSDRTYHCAFLEYTRSRRCGRPAHRRRGLDIPRVRRTGIRAGCSRTRSASRPKSQCGAVLVSNGAFGVISREMDEAATRFHAMGLALSCAAKHKLVGLLAERLKGDGVYVGEVMVYGTIKGTPSDNGNSVDPAVIADKHWSLYLARSETRVAVKQLRPFAAGSISGAH